MRGLHAEVADVVGGRFVEMFQECDLQCARGDAGMRGEFGRSEVSAQVPDNPILHHLERDAADRCGRRNSDGGIGL